MVPIPGIEPEFLPYQGSALPLYYIGFDWRVRQDSNPHFQISITFSEVEAHLVY